MTEIKRLHKSRSDRMIDGVCGGVAKYFDLDPTLVRIAWVVLTLLGGSGIVLYLIAMIVMPKEPYLMTHSQGNDSQTTSTSGTTPVAGGDQSKKNSLFWGILLIGVGMFLFLSNMGFTFWHHWWWFDGDFFLSVLLILAGVAFLWGGRNSLSTTSEPAGIHAEEGSASASESSGQPVRKLYRSFTDRKLFGVCGGLGDYFGIDSTIVRALFLVGALMSGGVIVIGYIIMAIVLPKKIPSFKTA